METANVKLTFNQTLKVKEALVEYIANHYLDNESVELLIYAYNKIDKASGRLLMKMTEESEEPLDNQ